MDEHRFVCPGCLNAVFLLVRVAYALVYAMLIDLVCGDVVCALGHARDLMYVWRYLLSVSLGREYV